MDRKTNFKITDYKLLEKEDPKSIVIYGEKLRPPSKRITLQQKNIKVLSAKIIYKHKKGNIEFEVNRINAIKSFGEIRLHTNSVLYPGKYEVTLEYTGNFDEENLNKDNS
jgi:hypothetical protein